MLDGVEIMQQSINIRKIQYNFIKEMRDLQLDALILPAMPIPAPNSDNETNNGMFAITYTALFNYLCFPAGVIPVNFVHHDETNYVSENNDVITKFFRKAVGDGIGMPIGIQIASYPYNDEVIVRIMKELQERINFDFKMNLDRYSLTKK